ncbi:MAG: AhpC/TSA family protein [Gammaproteobacteria bacterium]|nr:AhpC/TSA family protein [Gammaproteobacteria bacterium]
MISLNKDLKKLQKDVLSSLPPDISKELIIENKKLFSNFFEDKALAKGQVAPDVLFRDKNLNPVYLKNLLKEHHIVLSFFRGTWCPYCNMELNYLNQINDDINNKDARLIAVSPELYKHMEEKITKSNLDFPVFTDLGNIAANEFGLVFELPPKYRELYTKLSFHLNVLNGEDKWTLPLPATFIISKDGVITASYINADYTTRMEPADILSELDKLN